MSLSHGMLTQTLHFVIRLKPRLHNKAVLLVLIISGCGIRLVLRHFICGQGWDETGKFEFYKSNLVSLLLTDHGFLNFHPTLGRLQSLFTSRCDPWPLAGTDGRGPLLCFAPLFQWLLNHYACGGPTAGVRPPFT